MTSQKGPSEVVIRAGRASKCGRFAMSFGPSEKIDGANLTNKPNEKRWENGLGEMSCKPFSKDLIVRAIYVKGPQLETQTATVAMQLWLFC
ncbi:hypothetical protein HMPREF6485_0623 [Segatella buccae ATCC 33574]|uniref:Uncharacterized protein n=1 Tax=Segatella buccae ATCC 33574 TaxID=873513 RepID=E6K4K5_9BACT|nr:hypothetical protein HMPREF6485_0623 [Segatella buccae ATCC 33574]